MFSVLSDLKIFTDYLSSYFLKISVVLQNYIAVQILERYIHNAEDFNHNNKEYQYDGYNHLGRN